MQVIFCPSFQFLSANHLENKSREIGISRLNLKKKTSRGKITEIFIRFDLYVAKLLNRALKKNCFSIYPG